MHFPCEGLGSRFLLGRLGFQVEQKLGEASKKPKGGLVGTRATPPARRTKLSFSHRAVSHAVLESRRGQERGSHTTERLKEKPRWSFARETGKPRPV